MDYRYGLALVLLCAGCPDDGGDDDGGNGTTGGTAMTTSGTTGADDMMGTDGTTDAADSSTGMGGESSGGSSSGGGSESSTGEMIDCDGLSPINDPPDPGPPVGVCGYALPGEHPQCGPQPVPGTLLCAAIVSAFDPFSGEQPDFTDWRCAQASSGGYCMELQADLYSFCTQGVTTLEEFQEHCLTDCLIEIPDGEVLTVSYSSVDGEIVWDAPPCTQTR